MKLRLSKTLKFWVNVACEERKLETPNKSKQARIAEVLQEFEEAGDAMRFVDRKGRIAWKASPSMLSTLAEAGREAEDELDEWE